VSSADRQLLTACLQRQALRNISAVLEAAASRLENIVKLNIYITSMKDFALVNEAYDEFFTWDPKPVSPPSIACCD